MEKKPHLSIFFKGILMGIADLIPGISGSTIAIFLGIYNQFLQSIKNIKFKYLLNFKIKKFCDFDFIFLSLLFLGLGFSFVFFSKIIKFFFSS